MGNTLNPNTVERVDMKHGTITAYTTHGCRCAKCRGVGTAYKRMLRQRKARGPIPAWRHGTASCYNEYACRCGPCTDAERVYRNYPAYYAKKKAEVS